MNDIDSEPTLPPMFTPMGFTQEANLPGEAHYRATRKRIDPGTVLYSRRPDRLDAIVMLGPEVSLRRALQVIYPMQLAVNDALGALLPPGVAVHLGWPDRIYVNAALAGGVALHTDSHALGAPPDWILARLTIDIMGDPKDPFPGKTVDRTSLFEEGANEVSAPDLLEAFCRYFLNWLDRWERGGLPAVRAAWLDRAHGRDAAVAFPGPDGPVVGRAEGLNEDGDLILMVDGAKRILPLTEILSGPSWEL